jgi:hypothetical protein
MSLTLVDELNIIIEYIAGTTLSDTDSSHHSTHHPLHATSPVSAHAAPAAPAVPSPPTTLPNLFLSSSIDKPPVINLLNRDRGHSHVRA